MYQNLQHLLRTRRFAPLFVTQFLGALNDNLFKNALVFLVIFGLAETAAGTGGKGGQIFVTVAGGLFILLTGRLEVVWPDGGKSQSLVTGDLFGERSLLDGEPSSVTIETLTKCWLLKLDQRTFREVIMTHPHVLAVLSERASRPREEGRRSCAELIQEIRDIEGVAGIHVMAYRQEDSVAEMVARTGVLEGRVPWYPGKPDDDHNMRAIR